MMPVDTSNTALDRSRGKAFFGGSFDPVHSGHISMALSAYRELPVEDLTLIPTRLTYYKKRRLTKDTDRMAMLQLAVEQYKYLKVSDMELTAPVEKNYTVNTLERLKECYPDKELYFLIGGDSLAYLNTWREAEKLFSLAVFVTAVRGAVDADKARGFMEQYEKEFPGARLQLLNTDPVDISSTDIRDRVKAGDSIKGMVPDKVEEYILEKGLYRSRSK